MAEMRLIAETAFQADLRQAQVGVLDQQFGAGEALAAYPVLWRHAGAALEGSRKMTARQRARLRQFGDFQTFAETVEDQLLDPPHPLRAEATGAWHDGFAGRGEGDGLQRMSHGQDPCRWGTHTRRFPSGQKTTLRRPPIVVRGLTADELIVVNSLNRPALDGLLIE